MEGDRVVTDGRCRAWADTNPDVAKEAMKEYCARHPLDVNCFIWAAEAPENLAFHQEAVRMYCTPYRLRTVGPDDDAIVVDGKKITSTLSAKEACIRYRGRCNDAAISYCTSSPGTIDTHDSFCSCINSPTSNIANPECVDRDCFMGGYKTDTSPATCQVVDCSTSLALQDIGGGVSLTDMAINQSCGNISLPDDGPVDTISDREEEVIPSTTPMDWLLVLIVIMFLVVIGMLWYSFSTQSERSSSSIPGVFPPFPAIE